MKIAACYKIVPDMETVSVKADRTLDMKSVNYEIGSYDLRAVEEANKVAAAAGGEAIAITMGGEIVSNSKMKKAILSRGPSKMYGAQDPSYETADTNQTAKILKAMVEKIGDVELVLCGEGSGDQYNMQVGNVLGGMLGWVTVNSVSKIEYDGGKLKLERAVEDGVEVFEAPLPAVISVTGDINVPRIPSMKDILGAGKKPAEIWKASDLACDAAAASDVKGVLAPLQKERLKQVIAAADEAGVAAFIDQIRKAL